MKPFYLEILKHDFERRVQANPRYSLRAFARDLGVSPPRLSGILNQKFGLSGGAAREVCAKLDLTEEEQRLFIDSCLARHGRGVAVKTQAQKRIQKSSPQPDIPLPGRVFPLQKFSEIHEWYAFALIELCRCKDLTPQDSKKMARALDISEAAARQCTEKLLELGLLRIKGPFLKPVAAAWVKTKGQSSRAIRAHHQQLLELAKVAIDAQNVTDREIRTTTLAIDKKNYSQYQKLISEFQKKLSELSTKAKDPDQVYAMTLQFFRLDQP